MFCGIDAYHDALHKNHSIIALVTSMNYTCTRWASGTSIHNRGQEITDVIVSLFRDSLEMWHKVNLIALQSYVTFLLITKIEYNFHHVSYVFRQTIHFHLVLLSTEMALAMGN